MKADISDIIKRADIENWRTIKVEYGEDFLDIRVPQNCVTLQMKKMPCSKKGSALKRPSTAGGTALENMSTHLSGKRGLSDTTSQALNLEH